MFWLIYDSRNGHKGEVYLLIDLWFEKWTQGGSIGLALLWSKKIKGKICFVIHIAGEKKLLFYFYFVIVKQKIKNGALITTCVYLVG